MAVSRVVVIVSEEMGQYVVLVLLSVKEGAVSRVGVEKKIGSATLIKIFLVSAALSGAGQYWVEGANFGGLSGVVYGLVGYLWMLSVRAPNLGVMMPKTLIGFMLVWLALGFFQPFTRFSS